MRKIVLYFLLVLLLFNCGTNPNEGISDDSKIGELAMYKVMSNQSQNALNYEISNEQFVLRLYSDIDGSTYKSKIEVLHVVEDSVKLFELDYAFNTSESHWKIKQKEKVLALAEHLQKKNIEIPILKDLSEFIKEYTPAIYEKSVIENGKSIELFSSIYYYQSSIDVNVRASNSNSPMKGTIHPGYLAGKDFFVFQEDQIFDLSLVDLGSLSNYVHSTKDENLKNFIVNNSSSKIAFSVINDFYGSTEDFENFLDNVEIQPMGCSSWCFIGCGSDTGCCGNYSGCCVFSALSCYLHDVQCATCKPPTGAPSWYCGPACKPGLEKPVKFLMSTS
ncbi:hypothetical protein [Chryseobacterium sp. RR2-3-20]|uniref:hypothetical protein n=1 Tax=Chryseobacterium sp. RR2-3-20 TaxID=2787626 RepID=UPI001ADFF980|nr:hypothetical protein [Chryseobacterium sp. RR2-3-20]